MRRFLVALPLAVIAIGIYLTTGLGPVVPTAGAAIGDPVEREARLAEVRKSLRPGERVGWACIDAISFDGGVVCPDAVPFRMNGTLNPNLPRFGLNKAALARFSAIAKARHEKMSANPEAIARETLQGFVALTRGADHEGRLSGYSLPERSLLRSAVLQAETNQEEMVHAFVSRFEVSPGETRNDRSRLRPGLEDALPPKTPDPGSCGLGDVCPNTCETNLGPSPYVICTAACVDCLYK